MADATTLETPDTAAETAPDTGAAEEAVDVRDAELPGAAEAPAPGGDGKLDILLDTSMEVSVRLGTAELPARDLIRLGPGSVLTLDRQVGQPVDVMLRGIRFATGKLVVVGDQLGVRIEEILSPQRGPAG